jgi:hypothetical protein
MKFFLPIALGALSVAVPAAAREAGSRSATADEWQQAMDSARWTGPMLASTAETLPQAHFYTEPYFYDVISRGEHSPGSSGFYQYGLTDSLTVGVQPSFVVGTRAPNRRLSLGDFKLLSQLRLTHFTPTHRIPSVAITLNLTVPTGKFDRLGALKSGHGSGAFAPEIGVNVQQYFLLNNGRLLRGRINVMRSFPLRAEVRDRSVYGTLAGFRGHAKPGSKTTLIGALEYSLTREWVLAIDVEADFWGSTRILAVTPLAVRHSSRPRLQAGQSDSLRQSNITGTRRPESCSACGLLLKATTRPRR